MVKLWTLRWGGRPGLSRWTLNAITSVLIRGRKREIRHRSRRCNNRSKRLEQLEGGVISQGVQGAPRSQKGQGNGFSPRASRRSQPCPLLNFTLRRFQTSGLQNCETINLFCFKSHQDTEFQLSKMNNFWRSVSQQCEYTFHN